MSLIEPGSVATICNTFPDSISFNLTRIRSTGCGQFSPRTSSMLFVWLMYHYSLKIKLNQEQYGS